MIFSAKNEKGEPLWRLVLEGRKVVTRRTKTIQIGKIRAVQSKRGGKSLGYIEIISCVDDEEWCDKHIPQETKAEARREGYYTWEGLWEFLRSHTPKSARLYRMEFKKSMDGGGLARSGRWSHKPKVGSSNLLPRTKR